MSFTRVRTIAGRQYLYEETRWREGKKVRSRSISLGPVGPDNGRIPGINWEKIEKELGERQKAQDAMDAAQEARFQGTMAAIGLTVPASTGLPIEKHVPDVNLSAPKDEAPPEGEAGDVNEIPDR